MIVVRPLDILDLDVFQKTTNLLVNNCRYKANAQYSDAPKYADCISAVLYIYSRAHCKHIEIPIGWIGNMPGRLVDKWNFKMINTETFEAGDFIFLQKKLSDRLVTHVAIAISNELLFHCNVSNASSEICSYDDILKSYHQPFNIDQLMEYKDPRSKASKKSC